MPEQRQAFRPVYRFVLAVIALAIPTVGFAQAVDRAVVAIPAGTRLKLHVDAPISSNESKTGDGFAFELLEPISSADIGVPAIAIDGTLGSGTVYLAGHAGSSGHEGDLTLRLDSLKTADGRTYLFADQRFKINGRNRKVAAGVLGFVPYAGIGAYFIRGSDVRVETTTPIETVLLRPAPLATVTPDPAASISPSLTPSPATTATPSIAPTALSSAASSAAPRAIPRPM